MSKALILLMLLICLLCCKSSSGESVTQLQNELKLSGNEADPIIFESFVGKMKGYLNTEGGIEEIRDQYEQYKREWMNDMVDYLISELKLGG